MCFTEPSPSTSSVATTSGWKGEWRNTEPEFNWIAVIRMGNASSWPNTREKVNIRPRNRCPFHDSPASLAQPLMDGSNLIRPFVSVQHFLGIFRLDGRRLLPARKLEYVILLASKDNNTCEYLYYFHRPLSSRFRTNSASATLTQSAHIVERNQRGEGWGDGENDWVGLTFYCGVADGGCKPFELHNRAGQVRHDAFWRESGKQLGSSILGDIFLQEIDAFLNRKLRQMKSFCSRCQSR